MSKTTCDGVVALHISVSVASSQISQWEPERIAAFFAGLAAAENAARGVDEGRDVNGSLGEQV